MHFKIIPSLATLAVAVSLSAGSSLQPASAQGIITNPGAALQRFCEFDTVRQTIIYLDQSVIGRDDSEWFRDLQSNIEFLPAERIQFRMIGENNNRTVEILSVCHPSLTEQQYTAEKANDSLFRRGIDKQLQDAKAMFNNLRDQALAQPLKDTSHESRPNFEGNHPAKSIVEALFFDSNLFALNGSMTTRVVIFSDMIENSRALPLAELNSKTAVDLGKKSAKDFPAQFRNTEFYVYGIGTTHRNAELDINMKTFWSHWLHENKGYLASYSRQLAAPAVTSPLITTSYKGIMPQPNGMNAGVQLRLGRASSGDLSNSWFAVGDLNYPIHGNWFCRSETECEVNAEIIFADEQSTAFKTGDVIRLKGDLTDLEGTIGAADQLTRTPDGSEYEQRLLFRAETRINY